jgi:hypothetical protein
MIDVDGVAKHLEEVHKLDASYEYPNDVHIRHRGYMFVAGTANGYWGLDAYRGESIGGLLVASWGNSKFSAKGFSFEANPTDEVADWTFQKIVEFTSPKEQI